MPSNPWLWGMLIAVVGLVVALALWLGRGFKVGVGDKSIEVKAPRQPSGIVVAQRAVFDDVKAGDIAGVKAQGKNDLPSVNNIEVLAEGKLKKAEIGDIVGIKHTNDSGSSSVSPQAPKPNADRT